MVRVVFLPSFEKTFAKIRDAATKKRILKQFMKIKEDPEIGKPMRYDRRGTREAYVVPFRLSYKYCKEDDTITFLDLYHKDLQ
ncbi:MAG TPA: type II toxin-antitoxin system RelE/ParE family toxin [Candidatus Nanoarchaeia archaeon]|nr:type II toxin-antitoxin system RelE/ParE family toxin [Candidatus Nanoarchaeia archaeon]